MKKSDRRLDELMRAHPIKVEPERKNIVLAYLREQRAEESAEEKMMKKRNIRRIAVIAAVALSLTMMVSAAVVSYIYRTPNGEFIDDQGNIIPDLQTQSVETSRGIHGNGYSIPSVTWTTAKDRTSLAVWVTRDSEELLGLTAVIDGTEYPLEKRTFNLNSGYIGYTAEGMEKPSEFTLKCRSPLFEEQVSFMPEDVIPAECYSNGMTLFGTTSGRTIYIGINDENYLNSEIFRHAELVFVKPVEETVTDNTGAEYSGSSGGTNRDNNMLTQMNYDEQIPEGNTAVSMHTSYLRVIYSFMEAADHGLAPSVKVPLPADGETITGEWHLVDCDGFSYIIDSVSRKGNEVIFTTEDGLTYDGVYEVAGDMPGNYIYAQLDGEGNSSSGGSRNEWSIEPYSALDEFADENGEISVSIFEMGVTYAGDWTLDFTE